MTTLQTPVAAGAATDVLIVDDDFDVRDALRDILTDEGLRVATADDGLAALEWLAANPPPALILLDWMMPRLDGAHFRERQLVDPALASIPVVLLTADSHVEAKRASTQASDLLQKPVDLDHLLDVVRRYCGGAR